MAAPRPRTSMEHTSPVTEGSLSSCARKNKRKRKQQRDEGRTQTSGQKRRRKESRRRQRTSIAKERRQHKQAQLGQEAINGRTAAMEREQERQRADTAEAHCCVMNEELAQASVEQEELFDRLIGIGALAEGLAAERDNLTRKCTNLVEQLKESCIEADSLRLRLNCAAPLLAQLPVLARDGDYEDPSLPMDRTLRAEELSPARFVAIEDDRVVTRGSEIALIVITRATLDKHLATRPALALRRRPKPGHKPRAKPPAVVGPLPVDAYAKTLVKLAKVMPHVGHGTVRIEGTMVAVGKTRHKFHKGPAEIVSYVVSKKYRCKYGYTLQEGAPAEAEEEEPAPMTATTVTTTPTASKPPKGKGRRLFEQAAMALTMCAVVLGDCHPQALRARAEFTQRYRLPVIDESWCTSAFFTLMCKTPLHRDDDVIDALAAALALELHQPTCCKPTTSCWKVWRFFIDSLGVWVDLHHGMFWVFRSTLDRHGSLFERPARPEGGCDSQLMVLVSQLKPGHMLKARLMMLDYPTQQ